MKKVSKNSLKLLGSLLALSLSFGCASVPNVPLCVELVENEQGFCKNTIDANEIIVDNNQSLLNGKTWLEVKTGSLLMPATSWAEIKSYILKQCKKKQEL